MNNCEQIHETVIRDIIDVAMDVKNSDGIKGVFANKYTSMKSISSASSNLTLVFPVPVTRSINISNSSMVCKAIERKAVTMLQMLFSAINITDSKDAMEYISKFHTNLKVDSDLSVDQFISAMDDYVVEHEAAGDDIVRDREMYRAVMEDMRNNLNFYLPVVESTYSVNDFKVFPESGRYGDNNIMLEDRSTYDDQVKASSFLKNTSDAISNQIHDTDIKKANELIPTMMTVNFVSVTDTGTPIVSTAVIGVKAKMYPIDSVDIMNRITLKNKDGNFLNAFIRATTREVSFWKDFVFALDKAKLDALSSSGRGSSSKIWKLLERRALKSKVRRYLGTSNDASAITSLVISQEEVELLKKNENIDVEKPAVAKTIMDAYNLMAFVIIDEAMETVKFLYDDESHMYETLSFNHLERETSDGGYKKIINLMTKMSR